MIDWDYWGGVLAIGLFALVAVLALTSHSREERAVRRSGGVIRKAPPSCLREIQCLDCVIGQVGIHCQTMRFHPDGIAVVRHYIGDEFFFPFAALIIAPNQRMGDPCKLKIMCSANGRELGIPPYARPEVLAYLVQNGVEMPELSE